VNGPQRQPAASITRPPFPWRYLAGAAVLAAGVIWWSAAPLAGGGEGTRIALVVAIIAAAASIGQLAVTVASPVSDDGTVAGRTAGRLVGLVRMLPWAELMLVAVLALEALHRSRPWHTAVLGAALVGYLLAAHLTESQASAGVLRRQLPLIGLGLGLSALAVGVTALPSLPTGAVSSAVRVVAAILAVVAAGLAVPVWLSRSR
jgi:hypothetical protein